MTAHKHIRYALAEAQRAAYRSVIEHVHRRLRKYDKGSAAHVALVDVWTYCLGRADELDEEESDDA